MCVHLGEELDDYLAADHPAQRRILAFCERMSDDVFGPTLGVDGCGIPVFATTLRRARSFARFATLEGIADADAAALAPVASAMAEPAYVGGTARFDSALIRASGGRIVGKAGAEGVHGDALLAPVSGSREGASTASPRAPPATVALLEALRALEPARRAALAPPPAPRATSPAASSATSRAGRLTQSPER